MKRIIASILLLATTGCLIPGIECDCEPSSLSHPVGVDLVSEDNSRSARIDGDVVQVRLEDGTIRTYRISGAAADRSYHVDCDERPAGYGLRRFRTITLDSDREQVIAEVESGVRFSDIVIEGSHDAVSFDETTVNVALRKSELESVEIHWTLTTPGRAAIQETVRVAYRRTQGCTGDCIWLETRLSCL